MPLLDSPPTFVPLILLLADSPQFLVNPITPLLALAIVCAWGWLVSTKLDKDSIYFHLPREPWNLAHLIAGILGFVIMILPVGGWWWPFVGFTAGPLVMLSSILAYWRYRNLRVPADQRYALTLDSFRAGAAARRSARAAKAASITLSDSRGAALPVPNKEDPAFLTHIAMEELIGPAIVGRATTIEINPAQGGQYQITQTVDGMKYRRDPIEAAQGAAIIDYLKASAGLDIADKRRKQMGDFALKYGMEGRDVRLRTAGSTTGQQAVIEFDVRKRVKIKFEDMGLHSRQVEALTGMTSDLHGVILVAAPADNGRTTTMYALLKRHDSYTNNIRTLELEQLLTLDGVGHSEYKAGEADFPTTLRSMLRRDPNVMMVAELMDARTAQECAGPGPAGPLIYAGLRADDAMTALAMWCKSVGDLKKASAPLKGVVSQRLIRKLCENCRVAYQPPADQLKKLGLPADQVKQLFKPGGKIIDRNREVPCPQCGGLCYFGQTAVFEIFAFDDEARTLIAKGDLNSVKTLMRRNKMMTLQEAALKKAIDGVTSIEEVIRVTKSTGASPPSLSSSAAPTAASAESA